MPSYGSGNTATDGIGMDESGGKQWGKRINWANCREPYKNELDTLASHWIEGAISNGELAIELWQMWSEVKFVTEPSEGLPKIDLSDVQKQMGTLAEAMLAINGLSPKTTPEERRRFLDRSREVDGEGNDHHR